jgi:hypothetical protein
MYTIYIGAWTKSGENYGATSDTLNFGGHAPIALPLSPSHPIQNFGDMGRAALLWGGGGLGLEGDFRGRVPLGEGIFLLLYSGSEVRAGGEGLGVTNKRREWIGLPP